MLSVELQTKINQFSLDLMVFCGRDEGFATKYKEWMAKLEEIKSKYTQLNFIPDELNCFEEISKNEILLTYIKDQAVEINDLNKTLKISTAASVMTPLYSDNNNANEFSVITNLDLDEAEEESDDESSISNNIPPNLALFKNLLILELNKVINGRSDLSDLLKKRLKELESYNFNKPFTEENISWLKELMLIKIPNISKLATDLLDVYKNNDPNKNISSNRYSSFFYQSPNIPQQANFQLTSEQQQIVTTSVAELLNTFLTILETLKDSQRPQVQRWIEALTNYNNILDLQRIMSSIKTADFLQEEIITIAEKILNISPASNSSSSYTQLKNIISDICFELTKLLSTDIRLFDEISQISPILDKIANTENFDRQLMRQLMDLKHNSIINLLDPTFKEQFATAIKIAEEIYSDLSKKSTSQSINPPSSKKQKSSETETSNKEEVTPQVRGFSEERNESTSSSTAIESENRTENSPRPM